MIGVARIIGLVFGILTMLGILAVIAVKGGGAALFVVLAVAVALYGIVLYGFLHYRLVRQEELRNVLIVAAETKSPLADAIWAYVQDRPRGLFRRFCEGAFTNFLILGFYWSWHKQQRYDRRVAELASLLEDGVPLSQALWMSPGVASRETILAATVGESTGDLAGPLRQISQSRIASTIVEILPRLAYPLLLIVIQIFVVSFLMVFIVPKYEKILSDLKIRLPDFIASMFRISRWMANNAAPYVALAIFALTGLVPLLIASPGLRWRFFGISYIERRFAQGRLLKMLGMLLGAGKTVPQALALLRKENYLGPPVQDRLAALSQRVDQGEPLAEGLVSQRLMPANMTALLHAAERARNLPWALQEAGDSLIRRTSRLLQRFSAIVGPLAVALIGVSIGLTAAMLFVPIITIMTELTP